MAKCLNESCSNEVVNKEGKRARRTCSDSCRQKLWQKNNTKQRFIKVPIEEWEKLMAKSEGNALLQKAIVAIVKPEKKEMAFTTVSDDAYDGKKGQVIALDEFGQTLQAKKEFRPRRDDESGMDYRIAKSEWELNNQ